MKLELLADHPEAVEQITDWHFETWGRPDGLTRDQVRDKVTSFGGREAAPLMVLAFEGDSLIGTAAIRLHEMPQFPELEHWLSAVYVAETHRGRQVGSVLVDEALRRARALGIDRIYLQTEVLSGGLYLRHGFEPLEEVDTVEYRALVMGASP